MTHEKGMATEFVPIGLESKDEDAPIGSNMHPAEPGSIRRLDKYITLKPAIAFGLTVLASWEGIAMTVKSTLINGGPTALVYGLVLAGLGTLALAASLAELASIHPYVGAQYRWTGMYAPRAMTPAFWSLMQGWLTLFSWIGLCATIPFLNGTTIQGLIILNVESYVPQRVHGTLLMWAFCLVPFVFNIWARKALPPIEIAGGILHILCFIVSIVVLVVMAPKKSAEFVFTESFFGRSGWDSFDGVIHLSDEITDAPRKVPRAMMWAVVLNAIMALGFVIAMLFCIGDVDAVTNTPTGYPIIAIYYQATKSKAATNVLVAMISLLQCISLFGVYASVSRLAWTFAKDKGLPFSDFFARVHPTLRIPLNSLGLVTLLSALLGLINIGSTEAFNAILSLTAVGLYASYVIPVLFVIIRKLEGRPPVYGPFQLGRWSLPINCFGFAFGVFMVVMLPFPPFQPVTAVNMNYAGPILVAVILLALVDWFVSGRKRFVVPTSKTEFQGNT
ncbi:hypothetical protein W97_05950 [Coniosporium apollinis CBS 100218]|uniref:Uncharacterized protein n=1 Tax=Coniosporium apollinis (strain CBS 100218) TaxID=1168221 RepID=R7YY45_CONA1|nr:uncharacterized protein W97_05950 [Coniosporium apollinis CBS 100218]EON66704.1 hypothetical protein W97_05950 [Coniosporium apollinis CBS 100218]